MPKKPVERYPLESSPFYRMAKGVDLARILRVTPKELRDLIIKREACYYFREEEINQKKRSLAVPTGKMRVVHERIKSLLERIILNKYLFSPRRGRSSVDNALAHAGRRQFAKLDVKQFYPSTTDEHVFQFFHHRLGMVPDVAGRLTKLCTVNGRVAFGSPLSPILCALVHDDMFSRADSMSNQNDALMSVWVDDVVISGEKIDPSLLHSIHRVIASKRMRAHKSQRASLRRGTVVTGAFIDSAGISPANKSHIKMKEKLLELAETSDLEKRLTLIRSLIGLSNYFLTVYSKDSSAYERVRGRLVWLHNERREVESELEINDESPDSTKMGVENSPVDTIPWAQK